MKKRVFLLTVCLAIVVFSIIDSRPLFAAEKIVKMLVAMECECAATVNRAGIAIRNIPGVLDYDVNGFTREVTVKFDDTKTNVEKITEGLNEQNFPIVGKPQIVK